jgi:hypothetical protein
MTRQINGLGPYHCVIVMDTTGSVASAMLWALQRSVKKLQEKHFQNS